MAVAAHEIAITRELVQSWVNDYKSKKKPPDSLEQHIHKEVAKLELDDPYVNTTGHDTLPDETHVADMIVMDLPSYATDR